jgi:hypothetical protein
MKSGSSILTKPWIRNKRCNEKPQTRNICVFDDLFETAVFSEITKSKGRMNIHF